VVDVPGDVPAALALNYSETPNSCLAVELAIGVNAGKMLIYRRHRHLKELGDEAL